MPRPSAPIAIEVLNESDRRRIQTIAKRHRDGFEPVPVNLDGLTKAACVQLRKAAAAGVPLGNYSAAPLEQYRAETWQELSGRTLARNAFRVLADMIEAGGLFGDKPETAETLPETIEADVIEASNESEERPASVILDDQGEGTVTTSEQRASKPEAKPAANDDAAQLLALVQRMAGGALDEAKVRQIVIDQLGDATESAAKAIGENLAKLAKENVREVRLVTPEGIKRELGMQHRQFPALMKACNARTVSGRRLNVYLCGPAGSGKTRATQEAAKALGVDFYLHGAASADYKYLGFVDAGGTYQETGFFRAWRDGGVVCLDEADASAADAIIAMNAGLAGDMMDFPGSPVPVKRHADCVVIVCGNTWGRGGDRQYSARSKLDEATLNRFVKIDWPIDEVLERRMLPGAENWVTMVQTARMLAKQKKIEVAITPRDSENGAALMAQGFTMDEAAAMTYLAGLRPEQCEALRVAA